MLQRLERCKDDETVCFYTSSAANIGDDSRPALLLVHGFDSSSLEFRLLVPALERLLPPSMRLFAVDILGWGFGARPPGVDYGPAGKRAHLQRFLRRVVDGGRAGRAPLFFAGASLGGAVVADYFLRAEQAERERIRAAIFIDAQLFVDGKAFRCLVTPLDYLSLLVLRSKILRYWANRLAFHRPELHMSRDMLLISRMPCLTSGWMEASRSFLRANGYALSADLPRLARHRLPVLAIWGAQDRIVPVETVDRLCELYREEGCESLLEVVIIPECGHLPHLEHPDTVAVAIDRYLRISLATLR
jgi:pimeloyl-ACP methyl ester carboxylesterase